MSEDAANDVSGETADSTAPDVKFEDDAGEDGVLGDEIPKELRALRTQAYDKSISDIVAMIEGGDVVLDPDYQRSYVWDNKKASLLIESILLNVPIPVVYVAEDEDSTWTVVDGLQRLNTLRRFFQNDFKLRGLEILQDLNGSSYSQLNPKAQRILRNGILRMILIFKESHPEIKYDIFMRLNRGAIRLTEQELRNCLYRGAFNDLLKELRRTPAFLEMIGLTDAHPRMADAEMVLRYFALSAGYDPTSQQLANYSGKVKSALNRFCEQNRKPSPATIDTLRARFLSTIDKVHSVLGRSAFQRIAPDGTSDGRLNRAIMDVVLVSFELFAKDDLTRKTSKIRELLRTLPTTDPEFNQSITFATSDRKRLEYRLATWHKHLNAMLAE